MKSVRRVWLGFSVALAVLAGAVVSANFCFAESSSENSPLAPSENTARGSSQGSLQESLKGIDARTLSTIQIPFPSKSPTLLVFLSSKCPCSMSHVGELQTLAKEFPDVQFVGVNSNTDESLESAHAYFKSLNFNFPILRDEGLKLADRFRASKTPHAFLQGPDGKVLYQGGVSNSSKFPQADRKFLREALEDLKAGKKIRTPEARALGCAITRSTSERKESN